MVTVNYLLPFLPIVLLSPQQFDQWKKGGTNVDSYNTENHEQRPFNLKVIDMINLLRHHGTKMKLKPLKIFDE